MTRQKHIWRCEDCGLELIMEELHPPVRKQHPKCRFKKIKVKREHNPLDNVLEHLRKHEEGLKHKHTREFDD